MMSFRNQHMDRMSRRILAAMIVAGAMLTGLSFAIQIDPGAVKSHLHGLVGG
jgi:hypothetical protein